MLGTKSDSIHHSDLPAFMADSDSGDNQDLCHAFNRLCFDDMDKNDLRSAHQKKHFMWMLSRRIPGLTLFWVSQQMISILLVN